MTKSNSFIPCRKCSGKPGPQPGYIYKMQDGFQVVVECDCHKRWRRNVDLINNLNKSDIHPDYTFEDYRGTKSLADLNALKKLAFNYKDFNYKTMIYLWGRNGCQKSSMSQALGKVLIENGYTVQYTYMNTLINALIKDFNNDANTAKKEAFIKRCLDVDLLIIDESFDMRKVTLFKTGYQVPFLDNFIRNRFESGGKSILFISNKLPKEINAEGFGESLQNLIERNTKQSLLKFEDVYIDNAGGVPDRLGLFN